MRMQMNGVNAVNPDSVSGVIVIDGKAYKYTRGRLIVNDVPLMVSNDGDLVITMHRKVYGAVLNGQFKMLQDLTPEQYSSIQVKYNL